MKFEDALTTAINAISTYCATCDEDKDVQIIEVDGQKFFAIPVSNDEAEKVDSAITKRNISTIKTEHAEYIKQRKEKEKEQREKKAARTPSPKVSNRLKG